MTALGPRLRGDERMHVSAWQNYSISAAIRFRIWRKRLRSRTTDELVEVALVPARTARQRGENFLAGGGHVQPIGAPVAVHPFALDQSAPHQILDDRGEARLVAAIGLATVRSG